MEQNMDKENIYKELKEQLAGAEKVLVGIGGEWKIPENADPVRISEVREGYQQLYELIKEKDYFIVTTLTDGEIWETELNRNRIVAPCGNRHLYQCRSACVKEVWKETELSEKVCPHCKGPLVENTIQAENYGGFEKVGDLGFTLPRDDLRIQAQPGDVSLYQGRQIVLFYGSNTFSYTRLGRIEGLALQQLEDFLCAGRGSVSVTLSLGR